MKTTTLAFPSYVVSRRRVITVKAVKANLSHGKFEWTSSPLMARVDPPVAAGVKIPKVPV